jgi:hypothetical protein
MTQHVDTVVRRSITVAASQQRAFEVLTAQFGTWWPKDYHIGEAEMADFIVEPKVGGRWYEAHASEVEVRFLRAGVVREASGRFAHSIGAERRL